MRNILDKVHRELSVTKRGVAERELRRDQQQQEEESFSSSSSSSSSGAAFGLRGHDSAESRLSESNLRGSKKERQQHRTMQMLTEEDDNNAADGGSAVKVGGVGRNNKEGALFNRDSAMFKSVQNLPEAFPFLDNNNDNNATVSTDNTTTATIGSSSIINNNNNNNDHQLDIGAWLLMVLVVGFAIFGIVTYRSSSGSTGSSGSPRRQQRRRKGSSDYQYKGILPTLDEEDWGSA